MTAASGKTIGTLTASEKRSIEKVIRERFKTLRRGVDAQRYAIQTRMIEQMEDGHAALRAELIDELAKLADEAADIEKRGRVLKDKAYKAGLVFDSGGSRNYDKKAVNPIAITVLDSIIDTRSARMAEAKTKQLIEKVNDKMRTAAIDTMESSILEDLWIGDASQTARDYIDKIPTITSMIDQIVQADPLAISAGN